MEKPKKMTWKGTLFAALAFSFAIATIVGLIVWIIDLMYTYIPDGYAFPVLASTVFCIMTVGFYFNIKDHNDKELKRYEKNLPKGGKNE